ncbi:MAG: TetR/AcrR family transcriptional regulator [Candidatus Eremiobacteraeota bacterium]|nr:TetR/AcrR family transcriptional regulator [Candidatus Eremiobacteraeota bacterium]
MNDGRTEQERDPSEKPSRRPYDLDGLTDVALRVFAERGFDGATMDDVAAAAGITKAAIYHHVAGKEALLARGLERALDALFATLDDPQMREGPAIERLRHLVRRVAAVALDVLPELTVLVRVRGNSVSERRAIQRRREFDRVATELVRQAQREGDIPAALDPALAVRLIFGMCNSLVEWYRPGGRLAPGAVIETLVDLTFQGLDGAGAGRNPLS